MSAPKKSAPAVTGAPEVQSPALGEVGRLAPVKIPVRDVPVNTVQITWEDLVAREPRLGRLLREAERVSSRGKPQFCANAVWFGWGSHPGLKPRLKRLVGWYAQKDDPVLQCERAYDIAYQKIYHALPDCRHE